MLKPRVIPCLLLKNKGLVKGTQFKDHRYVGDPINAVHIFNSKEVDEILFLDITATKEDRIAPLDLVEKISDQCLVPFAVGGGIKSLKDAAAILERGAEKICINSAAYSNPSLITEIANHFGAQSILVTIDVGSTLFSKEKIFTHCGSKKVEGSPEEWAKRFQDAGAGEILINSISHDGLRNGYNLDLIKKISQIVHVPVIAGCGAGELAHLKAALDAGANAVSAGSMFVFHGRRQAVLINFPSEEEKRSLLRRP